MTGTLLVTPSELKAAASSFRIKEISKNINSEYDK